MDESSAAIEYEPVRSESTQRLSVRLLVVTVALLMGGIGGWVIRGWSVEASDAVVIGEASEFPPGSVTEVVVDASHFNPFGLERCRCEVWQMPSGAA